MLDLIANGLAVRQQIQDQRITVEDENPQCASIKPADDKPNTDYKSAESAHSAKNMNDLKDEMSHHVAEYAEPAENKSRPTAPTADLLREICGFDNFDFQEKDSPRPLKFVQCDRCTHFTPDSIGYGAGIGQCDLNIKSTRQVQGKMPLFRYTERHCVQYEESESTLALEH